MKRQHHALRWRLLLPGLLLFLMAGLILGRWADSPGAGWIAAGIAAAALLAGRGWARQAAAWALALAVGLCLGFQAYHPALPEERDYRVEGTVYEETSQPGRVRAVLRQVTLDGEPFRGGLYWTAYVDELPACVRPGERVSLTAGLYHPGGAENPGGFDFRAYLLQKDVSAGLYGLSDLKDEGWSLRPTALAARLRRYLEERLTDLMGERAGGLVSTMLLGSKSMLPSEERAAFSRLGIGHILSVSGFHMALLAGFLTMLMGDMKDKTPARYARRLALTSAVLGLYCLLTGFNPPVVRASIMLALAQAGRALRRIPSAPHILCAAGIVTLLIWPSALFGASFQLSYGALLGLILITPLFRRLWAFYDPRRQKLWEMFTASLGVQLGILLPQLWWYGELPLLSIPLNLLLLTAAPVLLGLFWLSLAALPLPFIRDAVGFVTRLAAEGFLAAVRWAGQGSWLTLKTPRPNAVTFLGALMLFFSLSVLWEVKSKRRWLPASLGLGLIILSFTVRLPFTGTQYIQFSVGSADAALLRDRDQVVVIDTGETGEELAQYLSANGLSVDRLILTHLHRDHAGGLAGLINAGVTVRDCYLPEGAGATRIDEGMLDLLSSLLDTGTTYHTLRRGDAIELPDGKLTTLWPPGSRVRKGADANDYSLVLMAELRGTTLLLTGDITGSFEGYLSEPADILKVAHHGSKASTTDAFLDAVSPALMILPCGDRTRLERVRTLAGDTPLYATRETGAVIVDFLDGGVFRVQGYKREPVQPRAAE
ncbi:MAG: DNA internalization-related competence protein ComEC/Rec2 [Clostridia bacterium]|nr:DNA internalization-related competence protein ComEC/Rec2 [Clostridia bacterium]